MFDYQFVTDDGVLFSCDNTKIEFDRVSPPSTTFILNDEMLEDINNRKYNVTFLLTSDLANNDDTKIIENLYNCLIPLESEQNINLSIQIKMHNSNTPYSTIITIKNIHYVYCRSIYNNVPKSKFPPFYIQLGFLCNDDVE